MNDDELAHYGKKGMHWGDRRTSSRSSNKIESAKKLIAKLGTKKLKSDNAKLKLANKKLKLENKNLTPKEKSSLSKPEDHSRISDADLKSRINRIEMEQKYAKLTEKQTSPGKKMVTDILTTAFKTTAQSYVTKMMGAALTNITTKTPTPTPTNNNSANYITPTFQELN